MNAKRNPEAIDPLGGLGQAEFLERHWQKAPLLVRSAFEAPLTGLTPEELAGLACEAGVDSRLVVRTDGERPWDVRHGPFGEADFAALPESDWTLLVQEVDRLVPEVTELLASFPFIPNWRLDDVMVSYATPGGGVGPHVDNYDVFLIQGTGRRRWGIGREPARDERLVPGLQLEVLKQFEPDDEWVLEPGDMLYLPPRFPHDGTAIEPSMTYSIGCRAPSEREILGSFLQHCLEPVDPRRFYSDEELTLQDSPGEIAQSALDRVQAMLGLLLENEETLRSWFGRLVTEPRRESSEPRSGRAPKDDALRRALDEGAAIERHAVPCLAFVPESSGGVRLFAGGQEYRVSDDAADAAILISGRGRLDLGTLAPYLDRPEVLELLRRLIGDGHLLLEQAPKRYSKDLLGL